MYREKNSICRICRETYSKPGSEGPSPKILWCGCAQPTVPSISLSLGYIFPIIALHDVSSGGSWFL
jgi:hypothetical protein